MADFAFGGFAPVLDFRQHCGSTQMPLCVIFFAKGPFS
jgi:hypothetical protein